MGGVDTHLRKAPSSREALALTLLSINQPLLRVFPDPLGLEPVELYLESAIETQRRMMRRRGKEMSRELEELIKYLFEAASEERERFGVKKGEFELSRRAL